MASTTTKVRVPKSAGEEIVISYDAGEPITYKVADGQTTVRDEHVASFVTAIEGSSVVCDTAASTKE